MKTPENFFSVLTEKWGFFFPSIGRKVPPLRNYFYRCPFLSTVVLFCQIHMTSEQTTPLTRTESCPTLPTAPPAPKKRRVQSEERSLYVTINGTPLKATVRPIPFTIDEDDDEVDEEPATQPLPPQERKGEEQELSEHEQLQDEEKEEEDDDEPELLPPAQIAKVKPSTNYTFIEDMSEYKYVCQNWERRPNETYIYMRKWQRKEISHFLLEVLNLTVAEYEDIIRISQEVDRIRSRVWLEYRAYSRGVIDQIEFVHSNIFDYRAMRDKLTALYELERRPRNHIIMILAPGSKPKFIGGDFPAFMSMRQKRKYAVEKMLTQYSQQLRRVTYWVDDPKREIEPERTFGDRTPVDVMTTEPRIRRSDRITTAFMKHDWKLEELFTIPELA